jgi:aminoglycoside 2'-N-acetyltransferase I
MADRAVPDAGLRLRTLPTAGLTRGELDAIRALMDVAFGADPEEAFTDEDWEHGLGGRHVVLDDGGRIVAHAALVERQIRFDGRPLRAAYVEAVATAPDRQAMGLGSMVMTRVGELIRSDFEIGVLGTGRQSFYRRLGWRTWLGPSGVRGPEGFEPTPDDDGYLMVLETERTPALDPAAAIECDRRPGDSW